MNFLQSSEWLNTKIKFGNKCYSVGDNFFQTTKLPFINKYIGYMPRADLNKIDFNDLLLKAKEAKCVFVTIDPDNLKKDLNSIEFLKSKNLNVEVGIPIHLPKTTMIDLTKDLQTLLSNMKQKTRYNLKLAQKKNLRVVISKEDKELTTFTNLYLNTVKRQNYSGRSANYIKNVWNNFKNNCFIATVYLNDTPLVSWFVISFKETLTYVYGGSSEEYKNLMAPYLLTWKLIEYGRNNGYKYLDLFGIKDDVNDGYTRFKLGFGGDVIEYATTIDVVIDPVLYKIIKVFYKLRNKIRFN